MKKNQESAKLIVEKGHDGELWGRVTINDNLIVDNASELEQLKSQMKKLILDFEDIMVADFEVAYDQTHQ